MKSFFSPNITRAGRLARGGAALVLLAAGILVLLTSPLGWLGIILLGSGAFVLFEALRGWCLLRACGLKTKL